MDQGEFDRVVASEGEGDRETTVVEWAVEAAEAVRAVNHAVSGSELLPGDVYAVVGALSVLVGRLPQGLGQLEQVLVGLRSRGVLRSDCGDLDGDLGSRCSGRWCRLRSR